LAEITLKERRPKPTPIQKLEASSAFPPPTRYCTKTKKSEANQAEGGGFGNRRGGLESEVWSEVPWVGTTTCSGVAQGISRGKSGRREGNPRGRGEIDGGLKAARATNKVITFREERTNPIVTWCKQNRRYRVVAKLDCLRRVAAERRSLDTCS
jgi:hypothetical protein